jgi:hypothetical protein
MDVIEVLEDAWELYSKKSLIIEELSEMEPKEPISPIAFADSDSINAYNEELEDYQRLHDEWLSKKQYANLQFDDAKKNLINSMPFSNAWYKVGVIGIAKYQTNYCGWHYEFKKMDWKKNMPKIKDTWIDYS